MTEHTDASLADAAGRSPGALLREARERRGMHIAALAAAIKVAPARLEALEDDDYSSMPDITFTRALAQAVCRALKVDPTPVLALMPESLHSRLERVDEGLKQPFRDRPGRLAEGGDFAFWRYPVVWVALALLLAAAAFLWWPKAPAGPEPVPPGAEPLASAPMASPTPAQPVAEAPQPASAVVGGALPVASAPVAGVPPSAASLPILAAASTSPAPAVVQGSLPSASAPASLAMPVSGDAVVVRAVEDTWVQVTDGAGKVLAGRTFTAGESVPFTGPLPLKVRVGNVQGTVLSFRGKAIDLRAMTKDNTVTVTLPAPATTP